MNNNLVKQFIASEKQFWHTYLHYGQEQGAGWLCKQNIDIRIYMYTQIFVGMYWFAESEPKYIRIYHPVGHKEPAFVPTCPSVCTGSSPFLGFCSGCSIANPLHKRTWYEKLYISICFKWKQGVFRFKSSHLQLFN